MKMFDQLVTIKNFREQKAERAVRAQRRVLDEAVAERDDAEHRLEEYRDYAAEQERRIYQGLCERVVRVRDIEDVHGQVRSLRERERGHEDELDAAETRRDEEEQQLESDRTAHAEALRMRDKFVELADVFAQEERAQAERKEEAEIEEAAETRRPGALAPGQAA